MCEKGNGEAQHVSPLLPTHQNPSTNPITPQTVAVKDKEAAVNCSLNLPLSPLVHSKPPQAPQNLCGTRLPSASKTSLLYAFPADIPQRSPGETVWHWTDFPRTSSCNQLSANRLRMQSGPLTSRIWALEK